MYNEPLILTINAGSSSIKFGLYNSHEELRQIISGSIINIGSGDASFTIKEGDSHNSNKQTINTSDFHTATISLIGWLEKNVNQNANIT